MKNYQCEIDDLSELFITIAEIRREKPGLPGRYET